MARKTGRGITPCLVQQLLKSEVGKKSQNAAAKEIGIGVAAVNRYLKGIGEPTSETYEKLSNYFGVSVSVLRGEGFITEKSLLDTVGLTFGEEVSAFEKYAYFTQTQFQWAFDEKEPFFSSNIHYLHNMAEKAKDLLKLPESFYSNIDTGVWETLKHNAQAVIEKYQKALETADDETKALFGSMDAWQMSNGNFYDLVTTPDYFTRLTATFDSVLSLSLKSKQAQQNRMFLAVAVSLAKLLRDMPKELTDMYDAGYMQDLQQLARRVIQEVDTEHLMERWTPPSIKPKLKQPVNESGQAGLGTSTT